MLQKMLLSKYPKFEVVAEPGLSSWRLNSASCFLERDGNIPRSRRIGLEKNSFGGETYKTYRGSHSATRTLPATDLTLPSYMTR